MSEQSRTIQERKELSQKLSPDIAPELNIQNAKSCLAAYIKRIPAYPETFDGRGIVICAGGRYFPSAWVNIHMLRHLGCTLPIQIWYLSRQEFDPQMQNLVRPLGVECIDASRLRRNFPARILNGWELKAYAMLHCPFQEILFLDADSTPLQNPEALFSTAQYQETGAIFWTDIEVADLRSDALIWEICDIPYREEPAFETGQIVIDKKRCWKELCLSMWFNEYSDFFYQHIYGDKDTFHMAFRKLNRPYSMPEKRVLMQCDTLIQYNFEGEAFFQHLKKWRLDEQEALLEGIYHKQQCFAFAQDLGQRWDGHIQPCITQRSKSEREKQGVENLLGKLFFFLIYGDRSRLISFEASGAIDHGQNADSFAWDIEEEEGELELLIFSNKSLTYILRSDGDRLWSGYKTDPRKNEVRIRFLNDLPVRGK